MKLVLIVLLMTSAICFSMDCLICLGQLNEEISFELGCSHAYHRECWYEWVLQDEIRIAEFKSVGIEDAQIPGVSCPSCRQIVDNSAIVCHVPQQSDQKSDCESDNQEEVIPNPLSASNHENIDEPNLSFWDIFTLDLEDQPFGMANDDDDN